MREIYWESQFKKDYKKAKKQGRDLEKLKTVIALLAEGKKLSKKYNDHPLHGNLKNYRDCHIRGDWVLLYKTDENKLILSRTGSHAEVLGV